jgi:hypothetical protein
MPQRRRVPSPNSAGVPVRIRVLQSSAAFATLFLAALIAYAPALRGGLVWDDNMHVTGPDLQSLHGLWRIWFDLGATQQYYPLLHSAFWLEHRLWGDPFWDKGVVRLITDKAICKQCENVYSPLIVPATFYKDLSNVFLSSIWNRTDVALRKVNHIIFCGYSFPDADIHIKYLLKRAQTNKERDLRLTVINNHPGKDPELARQEKHRYERFLGSAVNYTALSFGDFAADPMAIVGR